MSVLWLTTDKVVTTSTAGYDLCWWLPVYQAPSTQTHSYRGRPLKLSDLVIGVRPTGYQVGWIILIIWPDWPSVKVHTANCTAHNNSQLISGVLQYDIICLKYIFRLYCIMESGWCGIDNWLIVHCSSIKVWLNYLAHNQYKLNQLDLDCLYFDFFSPNETLKCKTFGGENWLNPCPQR